MRFTELGLEPLLLSGIEKLKYDECTPIQADCLPPILEGRDVAGLAQTGTGKTAAFLIPLMDRILKSRVSTETMTPEQKAEWTKRSFQDWRAQNFVLVLVPTRELAEQVQENVQKLSVDSGLRGVSIYGGTAYDKQKDAMRNGVEFVVATPGRLIDLFKDHVVDLKQVRAVVFDEADRMFDMGFKDDMKFILERIPRERQFLVFSATLNFEVTNTAYQFGADPIEVNVSRDQTKAENVKDEIFHCGGDEKNRFLLSLLKKHNPKQAIVFSNSKFSVERIARFLSSNGIPAMGISSLLTQAQRNRVLEQFKAENEKNILVATDVAARGLDIKGVDLVINYDIPNDAESYVHRIGRTGRAGTMGTAYSLVSGHDVDGLERVQEFLKNKIPVGWLEESELVSDFKPMTRDDRSFEDRGPREPRAGGRPQRSGGDRPQRGSDRGDRKPQAGGRRPQGDRPHRGGDRGDRGDRPQQQGDRPKAAHGQSGAHAPRLQEGRPHRGGNRPHRSGDRPQGENRQHAGSNGGKAPHKGAQRPNRSHGAHPHHKKTAPPPKSITQKVTGFFKKLLGS